MENFRRVRSIDRAVAILKCFSEKRKEMKLSDIADELDLNKSTVHGIISTLKYHGLIDQDEETQKYRLGLYLMELGNIVSSSMNIRDIAHPIIEDISNRFEETVHLSSLDRFDVVYIDKVESHQSMRIFTTIGSRMPAYCTGVGKAMLAYMDAETLNSLIPESMDAITPHTITDKEVFLKHLKDIRSKGYAVDNEESSIGLRCIAAPVFDQNGDPKYAISISGPTVRMTEERIEDIIRAIKDSARQISYRLGYIAENHN